MVLGTSGTVQSANGNITFDSMLNGDGVSGRSLIVDAGTGNVTYDGAVGYIYPLASLSVTGPTTLDSSVTTSGGQTYNSPVTIGGNDTITGASSTSLAR